MSKTTAHILRLQSEGFRRCAACGDFVHNSELWDDLCLGCHMELMGWSIPPGTIVLINIDKVVKK